MPVGQSGRIVIEMDPEQKQELYAALAEDGLSLKQWFLKQAHEYLKGRHQLALDLFVTDGDATRGRYE